MKEVLELIEQKKQEFAKLPFFEFLGDETIDPRQRLVWAPCIAYFAMMFKDFNAYVLKKEPTDEPIQQMINLHSYEDGRHWRWYIEDIKKLDLDKSLNFTDTLKFLWGEETKKTRELCYNLAGLCMYEKDLIIKLAIIESIEATGVIALPLLAKIGDELQIKTQKKYSYFSASHAKVETGHILGGLDYDDTENYLETIEMTQEQKVKAFEAVEIVFDSYSECVQELMIYVENHSVEKNLNYTLVI
ncbi:MAG: hypothetical protein VKN72_03850 [Nostocales cyanobacterium 94392]|nr:hypothetical protein [Nostocales cyanobacterium 94392]